MENTVESRKFWIFLLSFKRERRGLRTKGLLTITFAHDSAREMFILDV
jgi:hypothetical protein